MHTHTTSTLPSTPVPLLQGEVGYDVTLNSVLEQPQGGTVGINSIGGGLFEGLALYDAVSAKGLRVVAVGVCASAATLPLLASPTAAATPNARIMIHNPQGWGDGDAKGVRKVADELERERKILVALYSQHLTISVPEIEALMDAEQFMTAQDALRIGLIKSITPLPNNLSAPEYFRGYSTSPFNKIKNQLMKKKTQAPKGGGVSALDAIFNKLGISQRSKPARGRIRNIVLSDVEGRELDFGTEVVDGDAVAVGVAALDAGAPAEGDFVMPSGEVYVFDGGVLVEIQVGTAEQAAPADVEPEAEAEAEDEPTNEAPDREDDEVTNSLRNSLRKARMDAYTAKKQVAILNSALELINSKLATTDARASKPNTPKNESGKNQTYYNGRKPKR